MGGRGGAMRILREGHLFSTWNLKRGVIYFVHQFEVGVTCFVPEKMEGKGVTCLISGIIKAQRE